MLAGSSANRSRQQVANIEIAPEHSVEEPAQEDQGSTDEGQVIYLGIFKGCTPLCWSLYCLHSQSPTVNPLLCDYAEIA